MAYAMDNSTIAAQAGLTHLYHYEAFHADRLADILLNHRIYCSNPADFNDPWDCKPYFSPALLDDPVNHSAAAERLIATHIPGPDDAAINHRLRTDPAYMKAAIHKFSKGLEEFIPKRWGVYCLSPDPSLALMWSHYSGHHRGICLEFAVNNSKFAGAQRVDYQKEYPALLFHVAEDAMRMLLIKSDIWGYEQEFRLICPRFTNVTTPFLMNGDYLSIGPRDLKSIIVGCQAKDETIKAITGLVQEHAPHVALRYARRAPDRYDLVIEG